jgi:excisionase family DNA binding protein
MSLHKLSAGDGYTYLTRQVAAADDTHRGRDSLGAYYEQKGESPGVWLGSGLYSLDGSMPEFSVVGVVTEAQMTALFGEGRHPNADVIERRLQREGVHGRALDRATKLGHAYHLFEPSEFQTALAARYREFNTAGGRRPEAAIPAGERARIRTGLAREWFRSEHSRDPLDAREVTGYLTRVSRPAPMPVAGYDLTFSPVKSVSALWAIAPRGLAEAIAACHDEAAGAAEKLLTVDELCGYLVVSKDFIYDEVRHGRLRASRIARQLRFRPADVDAFVEAHAVTDL